MASPSEAGVPAGLSQRVGYGVSTAFPPQHRRSVMYELEQTNWIWRDGEFIPWSEARIHVLSHSVQFGSSTFEGETFASLHIDVGTYVWTWGTALPGESFTLQVPEPGRALLMGVSLTVLAVLRRSRWGASREAA